MDKSLFSCHLHSQSQRALVFVTYSSWVLLAVWTDSLPRESYPYRPITSSRIFWNFLLTFWDSFWNSSLSFWEERSLWDRFPNSKLYIDTQCQDSPLSPALLARKARSAFSTSPCCVWSAGLCYSPWRRPHPAHYAGCLQWGLMEGAQLIREKKKKKLKKAHKCLC